MRLALEHFNNDISMSAVMGTISSSVKCNPVALFPSASESEGTPLGA